MSEAGEVAAKPSSRREPREFAPRALPIGRAGEGDEVALLSSRVRVFAKALAVLVIGTYPIGLAELLGSYGLTWGELAEHPVHFQPILGLVVAAVWRWLEAAPRTRSALTAIDAVLTVGFSVSWITMVAYVIMRWPEKATSEQVDTGSAIIVVTLLVVGRAALIPSSPRRTAVVSALAFLPVLLLAQARAAWPHWAAPQPPMFRVAGLMMLGILVASLNTAVIHRLRQEVQKARMLGAYELGIELGRGASGIVYRARHALMRRDTAIKILRPEKSSAASVKRFEREVRLASRLTHPNTVAIYDYGRTADGLLYYAMELCPGIDLERLVALTGPLPPARVAYLIRQVCGALAEAHESGLVHRDIKPANILLGPRGGAYDVVKVADFGLARDLDPGAEKTVGTEARGVAGTPAYLPPEAIDAPETVDARSDLYCVGAVAYFLVTGTRVFLAKGLIELIASHLSTRPELPTDRLGAPVPHVLETTIMQCLEKRPDARPPSARDIAARMEDLASAWTQEAARHAWQDLEPEISSRRAPAGALDHLAAS